MGNKLILAQLMKRAKVHSQQMKYLMKVLLAKIVSVFWWVRTWEGML